MIDVSGSWPSFLKDLGASLARGAGILYRLVTSPLKAVSASVGGGVGLGFKATANAKGIPVEISAVTSISDSLVYEDGSFDIKNTSSTSCGVNIAEIFDVSSSHGYEHSYYDSQCTCNFFNSTFGEKRQCHANKEFSDTERTLSFSVGAYLLFGFEASVSIDLAAWGEELIDIYHDYSYGG